MHTLDARIFDAIEALQYPTSSIIRLFLAAICGGLIGLEREVRGRQAGFRTHLLVCLGSAIVMVVSVRFSAYDWPHSPGFNLTIDPARLAYGVMTGIGFLGAGAIIQHRGAIRGLTTGAGLWCVAAIGLGAGLGMYLLTATATVLVVAVLWALNYVEHLLPRTHYRTVVLRRPWLAGCVAETIDALKSANYRVADWSFERTADLREVDIELAIAFRSRRQMDELERRLPVGASYELLSVREI